MSGTYLEFPRTYKIDDYYFALIARLIRYEIVSNLDSYSHKIGLKHFVADLEKYYWHIWPSGVINFRHYCGSAKMYPEFLECLDRVRALLLSFGEQIPVEWKEKLKVNPEDNGVPVHYSLKKVIYWLNCVRKAVTDYQPFIEFIGFPFPPD